MWARIYSEWHTSCMLLDRNYVKPPRETNSVVHHLAAYELRLSSFSEFVDMRQLPLVVRGRLLVDLSTPYLRTWYGWRCDLLFCMYHVFVTGSLSTLFQLCPFVRFTVCLLCFIWCYLDIFICDFFAREVYDRWCFPCFGLPHGLTFSHSFCLHFIRCRQVGYVFLVPFFCFSLQWGIGSNLDISSLLCTARAGWWFTSSGKTSMAEICCLHSLF